MISADCDVGASACLQFTGIVEAKWTAEMGTEFAIPLLAITEL